MDIKRSPRQKIESRPQFTIPRPKRLRNRGARRIYWGYCYEFKSVSQELLNSMKIKLL